MRAFYLSAAAVSLVLGIVGLLLPVMPTAPFILLASWFLARSSPRLHARLRRSPLFGPMISDWELHHGVRLHVKWSAVAFVVCAAGISLWFGDMPLWADIVLVVLATIGAVVILRLRTVVD